MIKEDYVSYEVAKLLKEKGFNWMCYGYYNKDDEDSEPYFGDGEGADNWNNQAPSVKELWYSAPTHQMAMKWLREECDLHIIAYPYNANGKKKWCCQVYKTFNLLGNEKYVNETLDSYEQAVEAALKYCLTELI